MDAVTNKDGVERRSTRDLLAMVLRREDEHGLLERAGGIELLSEAEPAEIVEWLVARSSPKSVAVKSANAVAAAFELGRRVAIARAKVPDRFDSAEKVAAWAQPRLAWLSHEELWLIALDGRGHVKATRCIARGGAHGAAVRAADPLRLALRVGASAFVLVHNHPSGDSSPSREDIVLTMRVARAAKIVGIALLDHIVVSRGGFSSVPDGGDDG